MFKSILFIIVVLTTINAHASDEPKIIDAVYDSDTVVITLFYREDGSTKMIYSSNAMIKIDGKEYHIIKSDTYATSSQTGKKNIIVEYIFDIPKELKNKKIEMVEIGYSLKKGSPKLLIKSFKKVKKVKKEKKQKSNQ